MPTPLQEQPERAERAEGPEERFRALCRQHDYYYQYTDDLRVWERGAISLGRLEGAAEVLGLEKARTLWCEERPSLPPPF